METYQDLRAKAEESLKQQCPYAYLKDGTVLKEKEGRVSASPDSIYCEIIKNQEFLYTIDETGNKSGFFVKIEDCKCTSNDMPNCLMKYVWKL